MDDRMPAVQLVGTIGTAAGAVDFATALTAAKHGHRILRTGWNGKGFWVRVFTPQPGSDLTAPFLAIEYPPGHPAYPSGHLGPWLISPTDAMAEDWLILP